MIDDKEVQHLTAGFNEMQKACQDILNGQVLRKPEIRINIVTDAKKAIDCMAAVDTQLKQYYQSPREITSRAARALDDGAINPLL